LKNIPVGNFRVEGLKPIRELNPVLCRMNLDIDGILKVTAIEKETGKTKQITIDNALKPKSDEEIAAAREHLDALFDGRKADLDDLFIDHGDIQQENGKGDDHGVIEVPFHTIHGSRGIAAPGETESKVLEFDSPWGRAHRDAKALLERSRRLLDRMHAEDQEEAIDLHEKIESTIASRDVARLSGACEELNELLFFVEGQ
jgi:molecular chaperone DnaK